MLIGKDPDLGIKRSNDSIYGPTLALNRSNLGSDHIKVLRDRSIQVEGVRLYNAVPRKIREYNCSYLGFKNCIDRWIGELPDMPREVENKPFWRNTEGKPSVSVKDWSKIEIYREYVNGRVPVRKQKLVVSDI